MPRSPWYANRGRTTRKPAAPRPWSRPAAIYVVGACWLAALAVAAIVYLKYTNLPWSDRGGIVYIAWYGALGAATASMHGAIRRADRWHPDWSVSYLLRPVVGAVVGAIGYMIYISIVQASFTTNPTPTTPTFLGFVIAFALGYKEDAFRDLLQRVFDLVAAASGADVEPPSAPPKFKAWTQREEPDCVELAWSPADDNVGVVGYAVYRDRFFLAAIHVPAHKVNQSAEEPSICFCDRHVDPGTYLYSVSAFDRNGNESKASGPIRVTIPNGIGPSPSLSGDGDQQ